MQLQTPRSRDQRLGLAKRRRASKSKPKSRTSTGNREARLDGVPILIVEDDAAGARLLVVLLATAGADVRVAHSAEDALAMLQSFPAQVVVVDLILPRMNGLLFVQQLKASPATRHIVVIAVSVINGPQTERLAMESGCAVYVRKPLDIETFVEIVDQQLKGRS